MQTTTTDSPADPAHETPPAAQLRSPRTRARVARDFVVLLGAAAAAGLTAGVGMVLAVLALG